MDEVLQLLACVQLFTRTEVSAGQSSAMGIHTVAEVMQF